MGSIVEPEENSEYRSTRSPDVAEVGISIPPDIHIWVAGRVCDSGGDLAGGRYRAYVPGKRADDSVGQVGIGATKVKYGNRGQSSPRVQGVRRTNIVVHAEEC